MMKTITLLLKIFRITRLSEKPTDLVDGFFLKAQECYVRLERRW